jgi:hypothetical protein
MSRIPNLSWMIVFLMSSFVFAEDAKDEGGRTYFRYDRYELGQGVVVGSLPSRDIVLEGSDAIQNVGNNVDVFRGLQNENLIYRVDPGRQQQSSPGPAKEIKAARSPIKRTPYYSLRLIQIPSTTDSDEIRIKYLDEACKDYENKIKKFQDNAEKAAELTIKKRQSVLSQMDNRIRELEKRKAEAEVAVQKKMFRTDILAYLYKEKIKLELDQLEQKAKLEAMAGFIGRASAIQKEISETIDEIRKIMEMSQGKSISQEEIDKSYKQVELLREKERTLRRSLANNPENAAPKEQYTDIKITQIATEKRYQEVEKLIAQYEQSEKSAADLTKINTQLAELEKEKNGVVSFTNNYENALINIKDHPVRVINKADYDATQSQKAEKDVDSKESQDTEK